MGAIKRQQRLRHVPRSGTVKLVRLRAPKPKLPRKAGPHGEGWWQQGHKIPREYRSRWLKTSREVTREVRGTPGWSAVRLQNGQTSPMVVARHPGAPPRAPVLRSQMPEAPRQKVHVNGEKTHQDFAGTSLKRNGVTVPEDHHTNHIVNPSQHTLYRG